jgi:hypothetical protein
VALPTLAITGLPLLHAPPVEVVLNVTDEPTQTAEAPEMPAGEGLMVNALVARQPVGNV